MWTVQSVLCLFRAVVCLGCLGTLQADPGAAGALCSCPAVLSAKGPSDLPSAWKHRAEQVEPENMSSEPAEVGGCLDCRDVV